jgi:hypothetical protein
MPGDLTRSEFTPFTPKKTTTTSNPNPSSVPAITSLPISPSSSAVESQSQVVPSSSLVRTTTEERIPPTSENSIVSSLPPVESSSE